MQELKDDLELCKDMIANMCSEGRPPKMRIPAEDRDEDLFIVNTINKVLLLLDK